MSNTVLLKRSATTGTSPSVSILQIGEVAVNSFDGVLFLKCNAGGSDFIKGFHNESFVDKSNKPAFKSYLLHQAPYSEAVQFFTDIRQLNVSQYNATYTSGTHNVVWVYGTDSFDANVTTQSLGTSYSYICPAFVNKATGKITSVDLFPKTSDVDPDVGIFLPKTGLVFSYHQNFGDLQKIAPCSSIYLGVGGRHGMPTDFQQDYYNDCYLNLSHLNGAELVSTSGDITLYAKARYSSNYWPGQIRSANVTLRAGEGDTLGESELEAGNSRCGDVVLAPGIVATEEDDYSVVGFIKLDSPLGVLLPKGNSSQRNLNDIFNRLVTQQSVFINPTKFDGLFRYNSELDALEMFSLQKGWRQMSSVQMFIQSNAPLVEPGRPYFWVQTGLGEDQTGMTLWVEDGQ